MSKKRQLYNLRAGIMCEIERVIVLLEQILNGDNTTVKINVLADITLEKSKKISQMNEKIGRILKH